MSLNKYPHNYWDGEAVKTSNVVIKKKNFLQYPGKVKIFAHQGGMGSQPEYKNTMVAFEHAVAQGITYIEIDVRLTSGRELVIVHDPRMRGVGLIRKKTLGYINNARVHTGKEPLIRLEDLLTKALIDQKWSRVKFNIDPKNESSVESLINLLKKKKEAIDRVCISSFSDRGTERIREEIGPKLCTALGPIGVLFLRLASYHSSFFSRLASFISRKFRHYLEADCAQVPSWMVDKRLIEESHKRGLEVHVWTVNGPERMKYLIDLGVDGIMTDYPDVLKAILKERSGLV
jgi:glycerophosphoryl diester phosphodiesterase